MNGICVIVVTFNRLVLLKECIEGIKRQTYPIDKIIVVNNGSTDGTKEWLDSIADNKVEVIHQDNVGGAGGFYTGVKAGYEQGFEWVWMMDDDVEPTPNCLENLLEYKDFSKCLHPSKRYIDGENFSWEFLYNPYRGELIGFNNLFFERGKNICFINTGTFEGMLIHSTIINKVGYPNRDYFIFGDDVEYGFLASLYTNVSYIKDALMIRKKEKKQEVAGKMNYYYGLRNRHLLKKASEKVFTKKMGKRFELHTLKIYFGWVKDIMCKKIGIRERISLLKILTRGLIDNYKQLVGKTL